MRLIDADKLKQADFQDFSSTDVMYAIDSAPTIEAEPVKHGKWIDEGNDYWHCSECNHDWYFDEYIPIADFDMNYCPNCGAKMDKEESK